MAEEIDHPEQITQQYSSDQHSPEDPQIMDIQTYEPVFPGFRRIKETDFLATEHLSEKRSQLLTGTGKKVRFRLDIRQACAQVAFCYTAVRRIVSCVEHAVDFPGYRNTDGSTKNRCYDQRYRNNASQKLYAIMPGDPERQGQPDPAQSAVHASADLVCQNQLMRPAFRCRFIPFSFILFPAHNQTNIPQT